LIFNLDDGRKIGLSIESRRHKGDNFNIFDGFFYRYNLMYVWANPKDLLRIRSLKGENIKIYKIRIEPKEVQNMFLGYAKRTNEVKTNPEYYHIFWKNCSSMMLDGFNETYRNKIPFWVDNFAPGYLDKEMLKAKMID
jgi:hypothetical protein